MLEGKTPVKRKKSILASIRSKKLLIGNVTENWNNIEKALILADKWMKTTETLKLVEERRIYKNKTKQNIYIDK